MDKEMIKYYIISFYSFFLLSCGVDVKTPQVGLVEINGAILESEEIIKNINYFHLRDDIDGILVRVNSPGGGVAASQEIYEKIKDIRDNSDKPIVVSMSSIATSGGYYVSIGADSILANPGTITGSIGVIMGYPTVTDLMEILGLNYTIIKSGQYKDSGSPFRKTSPSDSSYLTMIVDELHDQFKTDVQMERHLSIEEINSIAQGQIFSGRQALELDLIDKIGTFEDAIWLIGNMTGFNTRPNLIKIPKKRIGLVDAIIGEIKLKLGVMDKYVIPEYRYK